jgi:hypothetical protein
VDAPFLFENDAGLHHYYRAALQALEPGTTYFYQVQACGAWSPTLSTRTLPAGNDFKVLVWGDMGRDGGEQILPALLQEAQAAASGAPNSASFAVIAGDFGYDLHDQEGARGARFMSRLSNVSAYLPTLMTIGNHEQASGNATHYTNIIGKGLPGASAGHWYSLNTGLIHWVFLSSEVYHMNPFDVMLPSGKALTISAPAQRAWLEMDLAGVDRAATPWLVAVYHRPFYCSNGDGDECSRQPLNWPTNPLRVDLEPLFMSAGVDLCLEAHEHSVEVIYPIVNGTVTDKTFSSPAAPVHFVTGAAGCNEDLGICYNPIYVPSEWTHAYLWGPEQYSYTRLWANSSETLHLEQVKVIPQVSVWSSIDIVQPAHGPFPPPL